MPGYAFLPDSSAIILAYNGKIQRVALQARSEARVIPFQAHVRLELGPLLDFSSRISDNEPVRSRLAMAPVVSPDGQQICFSSFGHLYLAPIGGGAARRLTTLAEREFQPAWSPDGGRIAFVTWGPKGGQIMSAPIDGGASPIGITSLAAFYRDPVYSPDGTQIFALRAARYTRFELESEFGAGQSGLDLIRMPSSGGPVTVLAANRGTGRPHFGPEPDRVYMYGNAGLQSMRFDGSDRRILLKVTGKNTRGAA